MTRKSIAPVGIFLFLIVISSLAANLDGTEGSDILVGTDADDEIRGFDGDDELRGGAGDDVLIGGKGSDIMFGDSGADTFAIDFVSELPDKIMDFFPEEGDVLSWRLSDSALLQVVDNSIQLDSRGVVTFRLRDGRKMEAVKLNRSDLALRVDGTGKAIRLIFSVRF